MVKREWMATTPRWTSGSKHGNNWITIVVQEGTHEEELEEPPSNHLNHMSEEEDVATWIMCNLGCGIKRPCNQAHVPIYEDMYLTK